LKIPNIIIIFCDDIGYGDIGCYGSRLNRTPRLDKMAYEGMLFKDFYVVSPVCSPSRAGLMTGCYPKRIGLDSGKDFCVLLPGDSIGLNPSEITIADILRKAGYATKIIGKWHLGDQIPFLPKNHGFDSYFGLPYSNDMCPHYPFNEKFHFPPLPLMREDKLIEIDPNQASLTDRYLAEAVSFINDCVRNKNKFFLYFAHMYVHEPIYVPYKYLFNSLNGPYGAAVEHLDYTTGVLLDTLTQLGIDQDTLVIFTSDNGSCCRGGGSNAPLKGEKGTTWEGGMREPCIMRWPGFIPQKTICSEIVTSMDFLPTLAYIAGSKPPDDRIIDGKDIRLLIFNETGAKSQYDAFFYYGSGDHSLHAVRSGEWKLHLIRKELYNLRSDICEEHNVYNKHPNVVKHLSKLADACRYDLGDNHTDTKGTNCRVVGQVENPVTLTSEKEMDSFIKALYD